MSTANPRPPNDYPYQFLPEPRRYVDAANGESPVDITDLFVGSDEIRAQTASVAELTNILLVAVLRELRRQRK